MFSNLLFINFLTNLILLALGDIKAYTDVSDFLTVYVNLHEFSVMSFFESFVTFNILEIAWLANVCKFSVTMRYFILIAVYIAMFL